MEKKYNRDGWSEEEDARLMGLVLLLRRPGKKTIGHGGRQKLADAFPDRYPKSVYTRFWKLKQIQRHGGEIKRYTYKRWTDEDIEKLKELYSQDKFHIGVASAFPDRHHRNVAAKAIELGLSRKRLKLVPFKLSEEERAFAAGMINGDGYVVAKTSRKKLGDHTRTPNLEANTVGFVNCEKVMVDWFAKRIPRGNVSREDKKGRDARGITARQPIYRWCLYDKPTACLFLEQIYPYLLGKKKEKAKIILERLIPVIANDIAESYLEKKAS